MSMLVLGLILAATLFLTTQFGSSRPLERLIEQPGHQFEKLTFSAPCRSHDTRAVDFGEIELHFPACFELVDERGRESDLAYVADPASPQVGIVITLDTWTDRSLDRLWTAWEVDAGRDCRLMSSASSRVRVCSGEDIRGDALAAGRWLSARALIPDHLRGRAVDEAMLQALEQVLTSLESSDDGVPKS